MKQNPSPNASPVGNYFLQEIVADLGLPSYTGDFAGSNSYGRDSLDKLFAGLNKNYEILLDTISLVSKKPGRDWDWQDFDSLISPNKINQWQQKWGNPGAWHKPISLTEFQKHALILYLIYRLYYYHTAKDIDEVTFFYGLLVRNPDFEKRSIEEYQQHMRKFKPEEKHRKPRIDFLISLIIDHEIQSLIPTYHTERGFSLRSVSLIPIMYYQMGILVRSNDNEFRKVRKCRNCNMYFWGHGNRRYCYKKSCDRRIVHKLRTRKGVNYERTHNQEG